MKYKYASQTELPNPPIETFYRTAPNVTMESGYYLQMKDDFGDKYTSPIFNLTHKHWRMPRFFFTGNNNNNTQHVPDHTIVLPILFVCV